MDINIIENEISSKDITNYSTLLKISPLLAKVLINRNINMKDADIILNNNYKGILSPYTLSCVDEAVEEILKVYDDEKSLISIYSDYDVDGLTSGYVAYSVLKKYCKCEVEVYYPERIEGYGINIRYCNSIVDRYKGYYNKVLVITVDNGITKVEEVKYLKDNGVNVVVTDHHKPQEKTPDCVIVDPFYHNDTEAITLSGCGVIFKVMQAFSWRFDNGSDMLNYTPALALSTLADDMEYSIENTCFIKYGLELINSDKCSPKGLAYMKNYIGKEITSNDILWSIAPKLNACGRMGNIKLASEIFLNDNDDELEDVIVDIEKINNLRKSKTDEATEEIMKHDFSKEDICIYNFGDKYPEGILGIIAGRVAESLNKPAIILGENNNVLSGSARSIDGVNILELFNKCNDYILTYGGHAQAAGIKVEKDKYDNFKDKMYDTIDLSHIERTGKIDYEIDAEIDISDINNDILKELNKIPFHSHLKPPMFIIKNYKYKFKDSSRNPNNICFVNSKDKRKQLWYWKGLSRYKELNKSVNKDKVQSINIIGYPEADFRNPKYATFKIINIYD